MQVVELGGVRLHVLVTHPGLPGEADRVLQALRRLDPALVLADLDANDALALRKATVADKPFAPGFVDALFAAESARRFAPEQRAGAKPAQHPLAAAARMARDKRADVIPIRPLARKPGFFARSRARKATTRLDAADPEPFADAYVAALAQARVWQRDPEVEAAHPRLLRALADGRAPAVAVLQAHRAPAYLKALAATGRIHA